MTPQELFDLIIKLLGAVSPFAIALLSYFMKKDSKVRKLEAKIQAQKEEEREEQFNEMKNQIQELAKEVKKLSDESDISKIEAQFKQLKSLNEFNFGYMQNLSKVVISIGDAIVNSNIASNNEETLKKAINSFKQNEVNLINDLYKIIT